MISETRAAKRGFGYCVQCHGPFHGHGMDMQPSLRTLIGLLAVLVVPVSRLSADQPVTEAAANEFFETKIRPVLVAKCFECHSAEAKKKKGGLHVDSRARLLKGGDN